MVIFSQTLSDPECARVLKEARRYAMGLRMLSNKYPVGETSVPFSDPNWNYNDPEHIWKRDHFLICIKAGQRAAQQKVISSARVSARTQEPSENPIAFLERVKEAFQKFTNLDLDSYDRQVILKDKFCNLCKDRTKSSPAESNQLCLGLSNNSGAQLEPHCLSGKAKGDPSEVYQSGLRLL